MRTQVGYVVDSDLWELKNDDMECLRGVVE